MSQELIEQPKVFISYAWESEEYKEKVRSFATDLRRNGVDVILDQWDLREGHDKNAFMEKSVTDESVTNVLILLSPQYAEKADGRKGGVGTETQIISGEVYGKVDQTKFLPVVFLRSPDGEVPKPAYLKSLIYFDLSRPDSFGAEYRRLVRALFGVEVHPKPELGIRPTWVSDEQASSELSLMTLERIEGNEPPQVKYGCFRKELRRATDSILHWDKKLSDYSSQFKYLSMYLDALPLRNDFNHIVKLYPYVDDGHILVAEALESLTDALDNAQTDFYNTEMKKTLVHELFLYFVAIMQCNGDAKSMGEILTRDYCIDRGGIRKVGFVLFYHHDDNLCNEVNRRDGKKWLSPIAKFWLENIDQDSCSSVDFVLADELCFNATIFEERDSIYGRWFPKTYIYDERLNAISRFSNGLRSKCRIDKIATTFGFSSLTEFSERFREVEEKERAGEYSRIGYFEAFHRAPLLCHFVESEQLGVRA